jgi:hypothetical protein
MSRVPTHLLVYAAVPAVPLFAPLLSCSVLFLLCYFPPLSCKPQKLLDNLDDASAELMLADDDEPVRMRVGDCFWGIDKTAAEEKLEALTEEAQQQYRQLEQQMAGGCRHVAAAVVRNFGEFGADAGAQIAAGKGIGVLCWVRQALLQVNGVMLPKAAAEKRLQALTEEAHAAVQAAETADGRWVLLTW